MTVKRYTDGRLIVMEQDAYVTNEHGIYVHRRNLILEDGTEIVQDRPMEESTATAYHPHASAPMEGEIDIPIVHVTTIPHGYATSIPTASHSLPLSSGPVAVVTGPPQPPRIAIVTGPPRPPPQAYPLSSRYVYRDESTGACMICGLSALVCLLLCCCCLLPVIIFPILWVQAQQAPFDDDIWQTIHDDQV